MIYISFNIFIAWPLAKYDSEMRTSKKPVAAINSGGTLYFSHVFVSHL